MTDPWQPIQDDIYTAWKRGELETYAPMSEEQYRLAKQRNDEAREKQSIAGRNKRAKRESTK